MRLTCVISFNLNNDYCPHSTAGETEFQRGRVSCSGSHSESAAEPGLDPRSITCRSLVLSSPHRVFLKRKVTVAVGGSLFWLLARV